MNVPLLPELEELVNEKVGSGQYGSSEEVVKAPLQLLKARDEAEERLETLLREADESGEPTEMTQQDWDDIRREVREHSQRREAG
jgi:putative addiction module CopG family antidote